jgi:hypothetical protein
LIDGFAASIARIIVMAADNVVMTPNSMITIHEASSMLSEVYAARSDDALHRPLRPLPGVWALVMSGPVSASSGWLPCVVRCLSRRS